MGGSPASRAATLTAQTLPKSMYPGVHELVGHPGTGDKVAGMNSSLVGSQSGGSAASGGFSFQHRVAAWLAVRVLAESEASPLCGLPADATLEAIACETGEAVDDVLVETSSNGCLVLQVKRTLQLSQGRSSELANAIGQAVRQFIGWRKVRQTSVRDVLSLERTWGRIAVVVGPGSSAPIRQTLPSVLGRLRGQEATAPLEDAAVTQGEQRALQIVRTHVVAAWSDELANAPSKEEIREVLSSLWIECLDVDAGGAQEREAKDLLRQSVLASPEQADAAWSCLLEKCAALASGRSRVDRAGLQETLLTATIGVKAARSYCTDIEKLREYSAYTRQLLRRFASIRASGGDLVIRRTATEELQRLAEKTSLLVVGEPGAGKSGVLFHLGETLMAEGQDVVFLAADRIGAITLGELRSELGLERELVEVLRNWPGDGPAYLFIDALDATRGSPVLETLRELITLLEEIGRWRVVASVRKFDLRYSTDLQRLFVGDLSAGVPEQFVDTEFRRLRHLNVSSLSDDELAQVADQDSQLSELLSSAPDGLRALLRVPFNLRLAAELVSLGQTSIDLSTIRTQIALLDRYWSERVISGDREGDAREHILRRACESMLAGRRLRVRRMDLVDSLGALHLDELLSRQVLIEWQDATTANPQREVVSFSHHVLFDYAVARLLFRGDETALPQRLADDRELVLVAHPSLVLHFQHLWHQDVTRRFFWETTLRVISTPDVRSIAKVIGPGVATDLAHQIHDLEPLCELLEIGSDSEREAAEGAFTHIVGALVTGPANGPPLIGEGAGPWCELIERVAGQLTMPRAYPVRTFLTVACDQPALLTEQQRLATGKAARRLLAFSWDATPRQRWLIVPALETVCRTYESDPAASATLLRRAFAQDHLVTHGFEEVPWIARETARLIPVAPDFVEEIYLKSFAHQETSTEVTQIGDSSILPLRSNRAQDYDGALYALHEAFPAFLEDAPVEATRTLMGVWAAHVGRDPLSNHEGVVSEEFEFLGRMARIQADWSGRISFGVAQPNDYPSKMLDAFIERVVTLGTDENDLPTLREVLTEFAIGARAARLWNRLLAAGAAHPQTLGREIRTLCWSVPILTSDDTTESAGEFLAAVFPHLLPTERERVERAILEIPDTFPADRIETPTDALARLLCGLLVDDLVTEEVRNLRDEIQAAGETPPRGRRARITEITSSAPGGDEIDAHGSVPNPDPLSEKLIRLERSVKTWLKEADNRLATPQEITAIWEDLSGLWAVLSQEGLDARLVTRALNTSIAASSRIARCDSLPRDDEATRFARTVLLEASRHKEPIPRQGDNTSFEEMPSWSTAPRTESAEGLVGLAAQFGDDCEVADAVGRLSQDAVPAVRFQIAAYLGLLYPAGEALLWDIAERMADEEPSRGVLQGGGYRTSLA